MTRSFSEWVDVEGLTAAERARLERVHDLLVAAGPPPELPRDLERPPAQVIQFPLWRRRPALISFAAAVTLAAATFVGGFFLGKDNGMHVTQVVALKGASQNELASLKVGPADQVGNNPMILTVSGLPKLAHGYYELFTMRHGKPGFPCTGFKMNGDSTTVHFTVPYVLEPGTQLVITRVQRGVHAWPGEPVMRSV
jgi:hypothetical protein